MTVKERNCGDGPPREWRAVAAVELLERTRPAKDPPAPTPLTSAELDPLAGERRSPVRPRWRVADELVELLEDLVELEAEASDPDAAGRGRDSLAYEGRAPPGAAAVAIAVPYSAEL